METYSPYVGYIPANFASKAKLFLSFSLIGGFIKNKNTIIMGHEDDVPEDENINVCGYPFSDYGYQVFSIPSSYYDLFLSYKIERPVFPGFTSDTEISLTSVSKELIPFENLILIISEQKHDYLKNFKIGLFKKSLNFLNLDREELSQMIKEKLSLNYIYNLIFLEEYNVIKF